MGGDALSGCMVGQGDLCTGEEKEEVHARQDDRYTQHKGRQEQKKKT